MQRLSALGLLLALVVPPAPAAAQNATLVDDLEPFSTFNPGSEPRFLLRVGRRALLEAFQIGRGYTLWSTDGTAEGTEPMPMLVNPTSAGQLLGLDLLVGRYPSEVTGTEPALGIWLSDGTAAGTRSLVPQGLVLASAADRPVDGRFYFFTRTQHGVELWQTDGRPHGASAVVDLGGRQLARPLMAGRRLFFLASERPWPAGCHGGDPPPACDEPVSWGLWVSDGTAGGTRRLRAVGEALPGYLPAAIHGARGDGVFFSILEETVPRTVLYITNGTAGGTVQLAEYRTGAGLFGSPLFVELGGRHYFIAHSAAASSELWVSDGTLAGTRPITDFDVEEPFFAPLFAGQIAAAGGRIVFRARDLEHGMQLWATDGRPEGTTRLTGDCPGPCPSFEDIYTLASFDGRVFATGRDADFGFDLWVTDGTPTGSRIFLDSGPNGMVSVNPVAEGDQLFFLASRPAEGAEIWALGAGAAAARPLTDFDNPHPFDFFFLNGVRLGSRFLFPANDGLRGSEPWVAGLAPGPPSSRLVTDLEPGSGPSSSPIALTRLGDRALFFACQGGEAALWSATGRPGETRLLHALGLSCTEFLNSWSIHPPLILVTGGLGYYRPSEDSQVWRSDGTPEGTFELTAFEPTPPYLREISQLTAFGSEVLFTRLVTDDAEDNLAYEIWASGGTVATTRRLLTVGPPAFLVEAHGASDRFYFLSVDGATLELWVSDGTEAGTRRLLRGNEVAPSAKLNGFALGNPQFTRLGGYDYFRWGNTLWRTDGTPEGTENLAGLFTGTLGRETYGLFAWNGALYLYSEAQLTGQQGLWRTDGTPAGTELLLDLGYGSFGALTPFRDALYFAGFASDGQGNGGADIWRSDGTRAGTFPLEIPFGPWGGTGELVPFGDRLFFSGSSAETQEEVDFELWESDGTTAGTGPAQDIHPGPRSAQPESLLALPDRLLFTADDGLTGRELWALEPAGPACAASASALCLRSGRIRAEAVYQDPEGRLHFAEAVELSAEAGAWTFFRDGNLDLFLKVLDGAAVNSHGWVFVGSLSNAGFTLTLTDTATGASRRYHNLQGRLASFADTGAFDFDGTLLAGDLALPEPAGLASTTLPAAKAAAACVPDAYRLCLLASHYAVEIDWASATASGRATLRPESDTSGLFWFVRPDNLEGAVKMIDGTAVNGHPWFFFTGLTHLQVTIRVTDTATGDARIHLKPLGFFAALADTELF